MEATFSNRGFVVIQHPTHLAKDCGGGIVQPLLQESSAIGYYENSCNAPGSSYLWVGGNHHLNREEISEMIEYLQNWLDTGRLSNV